MVVLPSDRERTRGCNPQRMSHRAPAHPPGEPARDCVCRIKTGVSLKKTHTLFDVLMSVNGAHRLRSAVWMSRATHPCGGVGNHGGMARERWREDDVEGGRALAGVGVVCWARVDQGSRARSSLKSVEIQLHKAPYISLTNVYN